MGRLIPLLLLCALARPCAAIQLDGELNAAPPMSPVDRAVLSVSGRPQPALLELRKLYDRYTALVEARRDDGWSYGLLSGEVVEEGEDVVVPARQLDEAVKARAAELAKAEQAQSAAPTDEMKDRLQGAVEAARKAWKRARRKAGREKGTCVDWSDLVWFELRKLDPQEWTVQDATRDARPLHTGAVVCSTEDTSVCLAFDPWKTGEPDVYDFISWDHGSFDGRVAPEFFLHHLPSR